MKARVIQFRRGRTTQNPKHILIEIPESDKKEKALKFINKEVSWTSEGKNKTIIKGKIVASHGTKGLVRAIFEKGLPGQAIGTEIEVKN